MRRLQDYFSLWRAEGKFQLRFALHLCAKRSRVTVARPAYHEQRIAELKKNGVNAQIVVLSGIQHFETYKFVDGLRQAVPWIRAVWNKK